MYFNASWHAAGLRWIGSLFNGVADYLDRSPRPETAALEQAPMRPAPDHIDEVRSRMRTHMRGLI